LSKGTPSHFPSGDPAWFSARASPRLAFLQAIDFKMRQPVGSTFGRAGIVAHRVKMKPVAIDELIQAMGAEKVERGPDAHGIRLHGAQPLGEVV
jgi:hypothetical protein